MIISGVIALVGFLIAHFLLSSGTPADINKAVDAQHKVVNDLEGFATQLKAHPTYNALTQQLALVQNDINTMRQNEHTTDATFNAMTTQMVGDLTELVHNTYAVINNPTSADESALSSDFDKLTTLTDSTNKYLNQKYGN